MRTVLRWLGLSLAAAAAVLAATVGLLQTHLGKDLVAAEIARLASNSRLTWGIDHLDGSVPFAMTARRITVRDDQGIWLTLRDVGLDIDPTSLVSRRLQVRLLRAGEWDQPRPPSGPSRPLPELLGMLRLPFGMDVERLVIDRLLLGKPMLGAPVAATLAGNLTFRGPVRGADLDIHRIDGAPGRIGLQLTLTGAAPRLTLKLHADDPTGMISDRILARSDHLPLKLSLEGDGKLADWRGRFAAAVGPQARLDADFAVAVLKETVLNLSAHATAAALLPAALAAAIGDNARLSLHAVFGERVRVDRLTFTAALGTVTAQGAFGGPDQKVAGELRADLPNLATLSAIAGAYLRGSAALTAKLSGTKSRPAVSADIALSEVEALTATTRTLAARVTAAPTGELGDPQTRFALSAQGQFLGLVVPTGGALAARLGENMRWSLAAAVDRDLRAVDLTQFGVDSAGVSLTGWGRLAVAAGGMGGIIKIAGSASGLHTGIAAADALLGASPSLTGTLRRDATGLVTLADLSLTGEAARLTGNARFDPAADNLTAAVDLELPRLQLLRPAIGGNIGGSISVKATAQGSPGRLHLRTEFDGDGIAVGRLAVDRVRLAGDVADLSRPVAAIDGSFGAGRLDGRLGLAVAPIGEAGLSITNLRLTAADSSIAGDMRVAFAGGLIQGSLRGRFPELSRWSTLAGASLGGSLDLTTGFTEAKGSQGLDFTINGARLAIGGGRSATTIGRLEATARLTDVWRRPNGSGRIALGAVHAGAFDFTGATASFDASGADRLEFRGNAAGHPLNLSLAGAGGLAPGGAELRLARFDGSLDNTTFALEGPVELTRRGSELTLSRLSLRLGSGHIAAGGALRGEALAFTMDASHLQIDAAARLIGRQNLQGDLSFAATLGGSLRAPHGRFTLDAAGLNLVGSRQMRGPHLGLAVEGDWNGHAVDLRGQVTSLHGEHLAVSGSLPLLLTSAPFGLSMPPQGRLSVNLEGGGDIGRLADLLPLGEDRLSGEFAVNASVVGTIATPSAGGRLTLSNARYENFASGAVLTKLAAELVGNGDRFRLASLSASDGVGGTATAQGSLTLASTEGPALQLAAVLKNFRIAARDEVAATASGTIAVAGPMAAPKVTAPLTIDRAEINLPTSLPPNVVVLKVTEINGPRRPAVEPGAISRPALPAQLDITLGLSGLVRVEGHGLDSQWSGRLKITGTTAAPKIAGTLVASRGSYTLLGKSFQLTRGTITFDGTARIDPALDIVAEASAADITAQVVITGLASAPKVALSSIPLLPQDEILARVLFGNSVSKVTAGQGLQLAQAVAALSGNDIGLLDRLRGGLGLDWLRLGQGPATAASSILNPGVITPTAQSAAALSVGKYIAPGVSIGVTQGVSPPTSKVTVEVDLGHHITVGTEAGQNSGTGIGVNYNYDY